MSESSRKIQCQQLGQNSILLGGGGSKVKMTVFSIFGDLKILILSS